jgi:hypothetical protein
LIELDVNDPAPIISGKKFIGLQQYARPHSAPSSEPASRMIVVSESKKLRMNMFYDTS